MTDTLLRDEPSDTGEIPRPVGEATERLNSYLSTAPFPTIRRSHMDITGEQPLYAPQTIALAVPVVTRSAPAVLDLIGGCRTVVPNDEDFVKPGTTPNPDPLPPPPPPKPAADKVLWREAVGTGVYREKRSVMYVPSAERKPSPRGYHRRPSRWDWLTVPLAMAWQRIVGAM